MRSTLEVPARCRAPAFAFCPCPGQTGLRSCRTALPLRFAVHWGRERVFGQEEPFEAFLLSTSPAHEAIRLRCQPYPRSSLRPGRASQTPARGTGLGPWRGALQRPFWGGGRSFPSRLSITKAAGPARRFDEPRRLPHTCGRGAPGTAGPGRAFKAAGPGAARRLRETLPTPARARTALPSVRSPRAGRGGSGGGGGAPAARPLPRGRGRAGGRAAAGAPGRRRPGEGPAGWEGAAAGLSSPRPRRTQAPLQGFSRHFSAGRPVPAAGSAGAAPAAHHDRAEAGPRRRAPLQLHLAGGRRQLLVVSEGSRRRLCPPRAGDRDRPSRAAAPALRPPREPPCLPGFFRSFSPGFPPPAVSAQFREWWDAAPLLQAFLGSFCTGSLKCRPGFRM